MKKTDKKQKLAGLAAGVIIGTALAAIPNDCYAAEITETAADAAENTEAEMAGAADCADDGKSAAKESADVDMAGAPAKESADVDITGAAAQESAEAAVPERVTETTDAAEAAAATIDIVSADAAETAAEPEDIAIEDIAAELEDIANGDIAAEPEDRTAGDSVDELAESAVGDSAAASTDAANTTDRNEDKDIKETAAEPADENAAASEEVIQAAEENTDTATKENKDGMDPALSVGDKADGTDAETAAADDELLLETEAAAEPVTLSDGTTAIDAKQYGAKGDGVNDDTWAINRAIESLSDSCNTLYIGAGTYRVDAVAKIVLRSDMNLVMDKDAKLVAIATDDDEYSILYLNSLSNVRITGGQLYGERFSHKGTGGEYGHGIRVLDCVKVTIDGVKIANCWGDGIYLGSQHENDSSCSSKEITIVNCEITGNRRNNISIVCADNVTIENCVISNAGGTAPEFGIDIETNVTENPNEHIVIRGCTISGNGAGSVLIDTAADDVLIEDSTLDGAFMNFAGTNVTLSNTSVKGESDCRYGVNLTNGTTLDDRGNTEDAEVLHYSAARKISYSGYLQNAQNRIKVSYVKNAASACGQAIRLERLSEGTRSAGIRLRLSALSGGALSKLVPGRTYRIQYTVRGTGTWDFNSNQTGHYWINPTEDVYTTCMTTYIAGNAGSGVLYFYALDNIKGMYLEISDIRIYDADYTGLVDQSDGSTIYSVNGNRADDYNGMLYADRKWQYVENGVVNKTYTGMAVNGNNWCYFTNGERDRKYTGFGTNSKGTWLFKNGRIAAAYTGMADRSGEGITAGMQNWCYVKKGQVMTDYTGTAKANGTFWYFRNGTVDTAYTGLGKYGGTWYYFANGTYDRSFSGIVSTKDGECYVRNGRFAVNYSGRVRLNGVEYRIRRGIVIARTLIGGTDRL